MMVQTTKFIICAVKRIIVLRLLRIQRIPQDHTPKAGFSKRYFLRTLVN